VQGALVAIDPRTRGIVSLVGGYDATRDAFNRATQARRQPGSSFKPFVYGAAIDTGLFTAASRVLDAPEVFHDPWTGKVWKPQNYSLRFDGEMSLRQALAKSKNIVAVRLIDKVGVDTVVDFARRAGIESKLPRVLPLALGAGEVTPLEHVNAYATLASLGVHDTPHLVLEVKSRAGEVLYRADPDPEQVLRPAVTFVLTDLMTSVMKEGTGRSMNKLDRTVAGKTGTANDQRDAWFVGFTPQMVCGVWVGFDVPKILGNSEYGSRAAGPAWLSFMKEALKEEPPEWFDPPEGVHYLRVDPELGLLAHPDGPGIFEPFVAGTEPLQTAPPPGELSTEDFLTLDPRGIP
jgi:penicillin-binding protein 1A